MSAPHSTPLGRWNPTVKLATVLVVSTGALLVTDPYTPAIGWVLTVVALLIAGRVPVRTLALAHVPFLVVATSLLGVTGATRPGGGPGGRPPLPGRVAVTRRAAARRATSPAAGQARLSLLASARNAA